MAKRAAKRVATLPPSMTAEEYKVRVRSKWGEAEFQKEVIALAKRCGYLAAHFRKVRVQRQNGSVWWETPVQADGAGFPDLILAGNNRIVAAELKVKKNRPTEKQDVWLEAFRNAGVSAFVWYPSMWDAIVKELEKK